MAQRAPILTRFLSCELHFASIRKLWQALHRQFGFGFGLVVGYERELGDFSPEELEQIRGPMGLPIERDLYFEPKPVSECKSA